MQTPFLQNYNRAMSVDKRKSKSRGTGVRRRQLRDQSVGSKQLLQEQVAQAHPARSSVSQKDFSIVAKRRPPAMQIAYNEQGIDPKRQVLYRNFHDIDGVLYLVEISRNPRKVFVLLFPNFENAEVFKAVVLAEKQAQRLMADCDNKFERFIQTFFIKFGQLQIPGFHKGALRTANTVQPQKRREHQLRNLDTKRSDRSQGKAEQVQAVIVD